MCIVAWEKGYLSTTHCLYLHLFGAVQTLQADVFQTGHIADDANTYLLQEVDQGEEEEDQRGEGKRERGRRGEN